MNDTPPNPETPENAAPIGPSSHVKNAPQASPGHNFDPQLRSQYANEPKVVHAARSTDLAPLTVSEDNKARTKKSRELYPRLNLSEGEFVVLDIKRHPIGMALPIALTAFLLTALLSVLIFYPTEASSLSLPSYDLIFLPVLLLMSLIGLGGFIAIWVYLQNQFFMTNESVIQEIQQSLFSRHEQTVSLGSIEDASYKQVGLIQTLLNYGTIRLSTEGEETTYRFAYVRKPRDQVAVLNNAIEAFKNGRPVDPYEN